MGMVDIAEDVAKSIGYNKIPELEIGLKSFGTPEKVVEKTDRISEILVGMGFQETMSFFITSAKANLENPQSNEFKIINPKSLDFSEIRRILYPELLSFFERNLRRSYPQRIFEIGRVLIEDREEIHLSFAICDSKNGFSLIRGYLESLIKSISGKKFLISEYETNSSFISGRAGEILINEKNVGIIGELHPSMLQ
ncbi:phenylalanyl-tRNA synthetase subunit beta, partial [mine drainage metagenome]